MGAAARSLDWPPPNFNHPKLYILLKLGFLNFINDEKDHLL